MFHHQQNAATSAPSDTATAYDRSAQLYVDLIGSKVRPGVEKALEHRLLDAFAAELRSRAEPGPVGDLGCGPGRIAAHLRERGVDPVGVDISHGMLSQARSAHGRLPLVHADLARLPLADRSLVGVVCWYSIIHSPPAILNRLAGEIARVAAGDAPLLVGFQAGAGNRVDRTLTTGDRLTNYRHDPGAVAACLARAGVTIDDVITRAAEGDETTPQAFIVGRRAG